MTLKSRDDAFLRAVRDFLTIYLPRQRCLSPKTVTSYKTALRLFVDYLQSEHGISLLQVTFSHLDKKTVSGFLLWLKDKRGNSTATCNQRLMALCAFARYLGISDIAQCAIHLDLGTIPAAKTESAPVEFLSEVALHALLRQPDVHKPKGLRDGFFMSLMYETAARCQEMLDLRVSDFVLDPKSPYVYLTGKGNKTRAVPLTGRVVEYLNRYLYRYHPQLDTQDNPLLFYTVIHAKTGAMSPDTVAYFMSKHGSAARAGCADMPLRIHPHQLRHTRAIHLYRGGMPLPLLSEFLGHSNINTTQIYAYADTEMKRAAINKACPEDHEGNVPQLWADDDETLRRLYGLI
jgi:site-specific recombinase XerD